MNRYKNREEDNVFIDSLMNRIRDEDVGISFEITDFDITKRYLLSEAIQRFGWLQWNIIANWDSCEQTVTLKIITKPDKEITYQQKIDEFKTELINKLPYARVHRTTDRNLIQVVLDICDAVSEPLDKLRLLSMYVERGWLQSIFYTAPEAMYQRWYQLVTYLDTHHKDNDKVVAIFNGNTSVLVKDTDNV
jgi:hypothetical protein